MSVLRGTAYAHRHPHANTHTHMYVCTYVYIYIGLEPHARALFHRERGRERGTKLRSSRPQPFHKGGRGDHHMHNHSIPQASSRPKPFYRGEGGGVARPGATKYIYMYMVKTFMCA